MLTEIIQRLGAVDGQLKVGHACVMESAENVMDYIWSHHSKMT